MNNIDKLLLFLIGGAGITNLFLGIYALLNDYHRALSRFFAYLAIASFIWILANFLIWFYPNIFLVQSAFASGALVVAFGLIWVLYLVEERLDYRKVVPIFLMGIFLLLASYVDGLILRNVTNIRLTGFEGELGNVFWVYLLFVLVAFVTIFFKLFMGYRKSVGLRETQLKYILIGSSLFMFTSLIVSFLLPALGYKNFVSLDSLSSLFFTGFIFLVMFRYKFLNPKIIATALLVFTLWITSLMQVFLAVTLREQIVNTVILFLVVFFGIFLVRSVIREVEQREKLENLTKELGAANEKLVKLDQLKSQFLSFASHQVKTPITVVKGYASLIADGTYGAVSEKVKEVSLKIVEAADRMVSLVNNLLDLRKIEEGRMDYKFSEIDLVGLVRSVVTELQGIATGKGLELKIELPQDQCLVKADEEKLRQVIQNLVDNAIKYTDKGWVKVGMTRDNEQVLVSVSDSGRGISADLLPRLFEQWTRDPKAAREIKGTGLGLYIAREIVNAHNGEIWAESRGEGKGSTFFVKLRLS